MKLIRYRLSYLLIILLILGVLSNCVTITINEPVTKAASEQLTPTAGEVQVNGITIAYESFGPTDRETILLIAGTGQQLVDWPIELVEELVRRGYRVVRFDNRDIGLSTKITEAGLPDQEAIAKALEAGEPAPLPYTLQDMAGDAVGLLDALDIRQAHLAGISMGGAIAQLVAIDYPERTLSLTSMMADSGNPELPVIARPEAFEGVPPQPTTADKEAYINWQVKTWQALSGPEYPVDEAILREWAERDFERGFDPAGLVRQQTVSYIGHIESAGYRLNNLKNITAPTVVLQGTEDPLVPVASAEDIVARVPGAELRLIPGLGHFIPVELVPVFADAITAAATRATSPEPAAPPSEDSLAGTSWQLVSFGPPGAETPVIEGSTITLEFSRDGQAAGSGGCNSYGGEYQVQDNILSFGQIVRTEMACLDTSVMEQEERYFQALQTAGQFELAGDTLTIRYSEGREVLNFVPATSTPPTPPTTSPTAIPATPPPASPTAIPTEPPPGDGPPSAGNPTRIVFEPGESSAEIRAEVEEHGVDYYVLRAQEGQVMSIEISSPNNDVLLAVVGEDGTPLKRYQVGPPAWTSQLPATQDYFIHAVSVGAGSTYTLRVEVEPLGPESAERVEFDPGASSATRSGNLPSGGTKQYVLRGAAGQVMEVETTGHNVPVNFAIHSPTGETWSGEPSGSGGSSYTILIALPRGGDYVVTLWVPAGAGATLYDVTFTISASATPSPTEPPERVEFAPGESSAQRGGLMPSGPGIQQYVLMANQGQTMTVDVFSDGVPLSLTIESPSGNRWVPEMRETPGGYEIGHEFTLPETGDYLVTLGKADHTPSTNFTVTFTIQ